MIEERYLVRPSTYHIHVSRSAETNNTDALLQRRGWREASSAKLADKREAGERTAYELPSDNKMRAVISW